jgi:hypothetical protein
MGGIVHQILDKMSSVAGILLFLLTILFDAANSFTGIGFNPVLRGGNSYSQEKGLWALGRYVS